MSTDLEKILACAQQAVVYVNEKIKHSNTRYNISQQEKNSIGEKIRRLRNEQLPLTVSLNCLFSVPPLHKDYNYYFNYQTVKRVEIFQQNNPEGFGNCQEYAEFVIDYFLKHLPGRTIGVFEFDKIDHVFVIVLDDKTNLNTVPPVFGPDCVIVDAWANKFFQYDVKAIQQIIPNPQIIYDPKIHQISCQALYKSEKDKQRVKDLLFYFRQQLFIMRSCVNNIATTPHSEQVHRVINQIDENMGFKSKQFAESLWVSETQTLLNNKLHDCLTSALECFAGDTILLNQFIIKLTNSWFDDEIIQLDKHAFFALTFHFHIEIIKIFHAHQQSQEVINKFFNDEQLNYCPDYFASLLRQKPTTDLFHLLARLSFESIDSLDKWLIKHESTSLLFLGIQQNDFQFVQLLLLKDIKPNQSLVNGVTALHHAIIFSSLKIVSLLVRWGADVNAQNSFGSTPLHYVTEANPKEKLKLIDYLVQQGAHINAPSLDNEKSGKLTPLHWAASKNDILVVKRLLSRGADALCTTYDQKFPSQLATDKALIELLEKNEKEQEEHLWECMIFNNSSFSP